MKKLLLLVLAIGMAANALAQPEVSDKWVISPVPTMKGVLGRLDINFPADVERNILIHRQSDNEFLKSVSYNDKTFTIAPGEYRFVLSTVPIESVPIKKGHETRLKAGFLDIVSEGDWHLYDETKEKAYTSGNKPKKLPLPVGRYQVKLGGQFYPVIIKDGETVEDSSPLEVKDELIEQQIPEIMETNQWVIKKMDNPPSDNKGRLSTIFIGNSWKIYISWDNHHLSSFSNNSFHDYLDMDQNNYLIYLNEMPIENVPLRTGYETKLKVGTLYTNEIEKVRLWDISKQIQYKPHIVDNSLYMSITIPVGTYNLFYHGHNAYAFYSLTVKDNMEIGVSDHVKVQKPNETNFWAMIPASKGSQKTMGRSGINMDFPADADWEIKVYQKKDNKAPVASYYSESRKKLFTSLKSISPDIQPGKYDITLSDVMIKDVWIEKGNETRLKSGILNIVSAGNWSLSLNGQAFVALEGNAAIYDISEREPFYSGSQPRKIILPVASYKLTLDGKSYLITIKDGMVVEY